MMKPTDPLSITLQVQEWNNVLVALGDAPYKIAASLVQQITEQARAADAAVRTEHQAKPNGEDPAHAPN